MGALKFIVIGLGALVVVCFGLLIYGLSQNWHRAADVRPAAAASAPLVQGWGRVALGQPAGAQIRGVTPQGDLTLIHVEEAGGGRQRLVVVDPARGSVVGVFELGNAP